MARIRAYHVSISLAACYAALIAIGVLAKFSLDIHFGALAVIPLLYIAYNTSLPVAIVTALAAAVTLTMFDREPLLSQGRPDPGAVIDAAILTASFCAAMLISRRLADVHSTNVLLRGRLLTQRRAAERDALTRVGNRSFFMRNVAEAIERGERVAVLFCDLDRFKFINDTAGHAAGDEVLRLAAERLVHAVRAGDLVARLGGDEFGVLVRRAGDEHELAHIASNIERGFEQPFQFDTRTYRIGITVGISVCPDDGEEPGELLHVADARMYRVKHAKAAVPRSV